MTSKATLCKEITLDITSAPHILIAGTTGSGKSVMMHSIICSLLQSNDVKSSRFILIDPKQVEFTFYEGLPGVDIAYDSDDAKALLQDAVQEMERRFQVMKQTHRRMWEGQRIYICIDELADLMLGHRKMLEPFITRLAQKGRAAGIHLILATQYPTKQVFNTVIKANVPTRIALKVKSRSDSMVILDHVGAELLQGKGDAILSKADGEEIHFQGRYLSDAEIEEIVCRYRKENRQEAPVIEALPSFAEEAVTEEQDDPEVYIPVKSSSPVKGICQFILSAAITFGLLMLIL